MLRCVATGCSRLCRVPTCRSRGRTDCLQEQFLCRAICQELAAQSICLKGIIRVRTERRHQLRAGLSERAALVEALIAVHRETGLSPIPAPVPAGTPHG